MVTTRNYLLACLAGFFLPSCADQEASRFTPSNSQGGASGNAASAGTAGSGEGGHAGTSGTGGHAGMSGEGGHAGTSGAGGTAAQQPPVLWLGYDAYRHWDRMPSLRIGQRSYMRSTYDRAGGNEAADASHFLRQTAEGRSVTLDVAGQGVLSFVRTNHWHGSPWHYRVDSQDHIVSETSTATPDMPVANSVFLPEASFPTPLTYTWSITRGADLNWVPMPFLSDLELSYERTHYGTGYYIYQMVSQGEDNLGTPLASWTEQTPVPSDVLALLNSAGTDIAPQGSAVDTHEGSISLSAQSTVTLLDLNDAPAAIRALTLTVPKDKALALQHAHLRITWDGRTQPSVDAPLSLLFGTGSFYHRDDREYLVKGLLANVHYSEQDLELSLYYPMPFFKRAHLELVGADTDVGAVSWHVRTEPFTEATNTVGYFHATYRDHLSPEPGKDLVFLDTKTVEGGQDQEWCGSFHGMSFIFSDAGILTTLEGDPRFFFDDSETPQAQGTGTEEWGGGGDYWGGQTMTLPLAGHPVGAPSTNAMGEDLVESAYRHLIADSFAFGKNARIQLEHGGVDASAEHYQSVTYWYGLPGACLVQTDSLHVSDTTQETAHDYQSPTASPVDTITSRYEIGVDHLDGTEIVPATTDTGRHMTGRSEFTMNLAPENLGALLRRKLDYQYANQRAKVSVADSASSPFVSAGTWFLAGSNQCIYSFPQDELGDAVHTTESSNRRFRDDEFLLPRALTQGRSSVRIRIEFEPVELPLYPGADPEPNAWSELRYTLYSYRMPPPP